MKDHLPPRNFVLNVRVKDESQIFSDYTYNEDNLNYELGNYLQEKAEHEFPLPVKENYVINIHTDNPNLRLPEVTRCIHHHFHDRYDAEKRKLRDNLRFALVLFSISIFALIGYFLVETYISNFFLTKIAELLTCVFGWSAVEIGLIERHSIRRRGIILRRLAYAEIKFTSNMKLDAPVYI